MAIQIEPDFLQEVKDHMRISYDEDDDLIKNELEVAILNIYTIHMLKPETDIPTSTNGLDARVKLAVKHLATSYRSNPDDRKESKYIAYDKTLINKILGSHMGYPKEL